LTTLQFLSEVVDKSRSLIEKLQKEKLQVIAETKQALDEKDISHSQAIASVKNQKAKCYPNTTQDAED
jgi:hypothetical protein